MEIKINYNFKDKTLLETALTHKSYSYEKGDNIQNNERIEFLGDAVLELVISDYIFKKYPELSEGELTKLRASIVCEPSLAKRARQINLGENLKLGKGEEATGGQDRDSILSDAFEAIIGAIYLDSNDIKCVEKFIIDNMKEIITEKRETFQMSDSKTYLQEIIQKTSLEPIKYEILKEEGPAHNKRFTIKATHKGETLGIGTGRNKKEAEQKAAFRAIQNLEIAKI